MSLEVKFFTSDNIDEIDPNAWDNLALASRFNNPFYERELLTTALECFKGNHVIHLVVAYNKNQMIALFPIKVDKNYLGFSLLSVWKYSQCLLCDPLCSDINLMNSIMISLIDKMKVLSIDIEHYTYKAYGEFVERQSFSVFYKRGAVLNCKELEQHFSRLPKKIRSENRRIKNRLLKQSNVTYLTSNDHHSIDWIKAYCELEHKGWKKAAKGSIYSKLSVTQFYERICMTHSSNRRVEFQGLFLKDEPLAISFRLVFNRCAYDLKTTYNEKYKHLYPGVVLELFNLKDLENYDINLVDSCTSSDNKVVNRLWPSQRKVYGCIFFSQHPLARLIKLAYRFKKTRLITKLAKRG